MGIASLVLGIFAVIFSILGFIPLFGAVFAWIGVCLGVPGIVLGAIGTKKGARCAVAGLVLSIIATAISFIILVACYLQSMKTDPL